MSEQEHKRDAYAELPPPRHQVPGAQGEPGLGNLHIRVFRVVLVAAACIMAFIAVRSMFFPPFGWVDLGNFAGVVLAWFVVRRRPGWFRPIAWAVLAFFFCNAIFDGLWPLGAEPVTATHVVLPLLVLYGCLLGDLKMGLLATALVMAIYGFTYMQYAPLSRVDYMRLTNLMLVTVGAGLTCGVVWAHHRKLVAAYQAKAQALQNELWENLRLNAVLFHDIANPLNAIHRITEVSRFRAMNADDVERIERHTERIGAILKTVRRFSMEADWAPPLIPVRVVSLVDEVQEVFRWRLHDKELTLELLRGGELEVRTRADLFTNSVLSNFISNAIRFTPRGGRIEISAERHENEIHLAVRDGGTGIEARALAALQHGGPQNSLPGTESEPGQGLGLWIATLYLAKLNGRLEIDNHPDGGALLTAILPTADL